MFWTDWGNPGKIERAYMDGTERMTLANTNLVWPNDITIDHEVRTNQKITKPLLIISTLCCIKHNIAITFTQRCFSILLL